MPSTKRGMAAAATGVGELLERQPVRGAPVASSNIAAASERPSAAASERPSAADDPIYQLTVDAEWSEGEDPEPLDEGFAAALLEEIRAWKATLSSKTESVCLQTSTVSHPSPTQSSAAQR